MIIEIPNENSIIKWKNNTYDEWKVAEISDLIKAYERPQGEWIKIGEIGLAYKCNKCDEVSVMPENFCPNCGADMRGKKNE